MYFMRSFICGRLSLAGLGLLKGGELLDDGVAAIHEEAEVRLGV
jgi:hypothetical protein